MSEFEVPSFDSLDVDDELDLDGYTSIEPQRTEFEITDVDLEQKDNGKMYVMQFTPVEDGVIGFPVRFTGWVSYANPEAPDKAAKAVQIGVGNLKRLFKAVYGEPRGSITGLRGNCVSAWLSEDNNGFPQVGRFQPVAD